jgi:hypothetical protein
VRRSFAVLLDDVVVMIVCRQVFGSVMGMNLRGQVFGCGVIVPMPIPMREMLSMIMLLVFVVVCHFYSRWSGAANLKYGQDIANFLHGIFQLLRTVIAKL